MTSKIPQYVKMQFKVKIKILTAVMISDYLWIFFWTDLLMGIAV